VDYKLIDLGNHAPQTGDQQVGFEIYTLVGTADYTADLDVDSISGAGHTALLTTNVTPTTIEAGSSEAFLASLDTDSDQGLFSATWTAEVSDEDLPGATDGDDLVLQLTGYVAINGDVDLDKTVGPFDLGLLLEHYTQSGGLEWGDGDMDFDGAVGPFDLGLLLENYTMEVGQSVGLGPLFEASGSDYQNPEPSTALLLATGAVALLLTNVGRRFRRRGATS
jgi:hypothetical protein